MKHSIASSFLFLLLFLVQAISAATIVIDFEEFRSSGQGAGGIETPYTVSGFELIDSSGLLLYWLSDDENFFGQPAVFQAGEQFTLRRNDDLPFDFLGLSVAPGALFIDYLQIFEVTGFFADGSSQSEVVYVDGYPFFIEQSFSMNGISRLEWNIPLSDLVQFTSLILRTPSGSTSTEVPEANSIFSLITACSLFLYKKLRS